MTQRTRTDRADLHADGLLMLGGALRPGRWPSSALQLPLDIDRIRGARSPALAERNPRPGAPGGRRLAVERVAEFVDLLIDEESDGCDAYLAEIAARTGEPQLVAAELLGPAARLVGDYWRMDVCDFMKVTVVMSRIQRLFWQLVSLYPPLVRPSGGRTALLTPLPDEQHSFGLAVVEDALRRAGWQVDCCGADEEDAYFELLSSNSYTVIGISLSGQALAPALPAFIRKSRRKSRNASAGIMVGGGIFVEKPGLAFDAGSDFLALDASAAVRVAEEAAASSIYAS